ncbi:MAG TPA: hypothetical protein VKD72_28960 [Gemmataceae bacterium]|nr:hypothetical protein [Gemmataceae bacterium]
MMKTNAINLDGLGRFAADTAMKAAVHHLILINQSPSPGRVCTKKP